MNLATNQYALDLIDLYQSGKHQKVIDLSVILEKDLAKNAIAHDVIAASNVALGHLENAKTHYILSLSLASDNPESQNNLGVVYENLGHPKKAESCFKKAINLNKKYAAPYFGIGNIYRLRKLHEKAIQNYKTAINLKPDHFDAKNNLGATLLEAGNSREAIVVLTELVETHVHYGAGFNNLGLALASIGDYQKAMENFALAASKSPEDMSFWENLGTSLSASGLSFTKYDSFYETIFLNLLNKQTTHNPSMIAPSIIRFLLNNPIFARYINEESDKKRKSGFYIQAINDFSKLPLLMKLMELCPLSDLKIEKLFTKCRKEVLLNLHLLDDLQKPIQFLHALALQCYTNEYIYWQTDEEKEKVSEYIELAKLEINKGGDIPSHIIAIIACYRPLNTLSWSHSIVQNPINQQLIDRQLAESKVEAVLSKNIPILKEITNQISEEVRKQYEENPYPRWVNTILFENPLTVYDCLQNIGLRLRDDVKHIKKPKILIAGCGTGRHALLTKSRFKDATVTAIDLSLKSLGYAKRKTEELGVKNIHYVQGDLLDLSDHHKEQYDIIESAGVLHHMENPEDGLQNLIFALKPGGVMRLALYSEHARKGVVSAREYLAKTNDTGPIEAKIRSFRQSIIEGKDSHAKNFYFVTNWPDFYSMSECRDLFFHAKEHQFTLPKIQVMLDKVNLIFAGFEFNGNRTYAEFAMKYKSENANQSLDLWDEYEKDNPSTFLGMYQFWVQKPNAKKTV